MTCEVVDLPGVGRAIICGRFPRKRCKCGAWADLLCDWKAPRKKSGTCDEPICGRCTFSPAPDKDLCPTHRQAYDAWVASKAEGGSND